MMADIIHTSSLLGERCLRLQHQSGMEIWLCPKDVTSVSAQIGVKYGSADIPPHMPDAPLGIAHFLEHKVFEAPKGESFDMAFSALGAEVNAYTSYDKTVYYVNCTRHFEEVLTTLLTMVSSLYVTASSVKKEKSIIAEEIRMNRDSPFERCYAELLLTMYQNHRMREEICGSEASIRRITPQMLQDIFAMYYRPDNMVLTVCGNVTEEAILACVDKVFGSFDPAHAPPLPQITLADEPALPAKASTTLQMQVPNPLLSVGCKCLTYPQDPATLFRQTLCMGVLCEMLFARSAELYDTLFEEGMITPTYAYGYSLGKDYGDISLSCECHDPEAVYARICQYLAEVAQKGLCRQDFDRAKRVMYADYVTGFDLTDDIASYLMSYAMDGVMLFDFLDILPRITEEEVWDFFVTYLTPEHMTYSIVRG